MLRMFRLAAVALALAWTVAAPAQTYPSKPIRWIVPYTPGGITDNVTRVVTQRVHEQTGWNIVVENKPGANSILGADLAAKSAPDGYTFVTLIAAHAANATLYAGKLPFDPVKSFAPVALAAVAPLIMTANNDFPPKDVKELIAYAKANPGKISFGSSGIGAAAHLTTELFMQAAGVNMVHIPYKGAAPQLQDLMAGNIQIMVGVPSDMMSQLRGGKIASLAIFSNKRNPSLPDMPTMAEAGGPALEASTWVMFLAPAGTAQEIVNRLSAEVAKAVATGDIKGRFEAIGIDPIGNAPEQAGKFMAEEIAKWAKVITTAGVKAEQ
jgi:tripartite-type tricarboxylate transporter receptor subunit TctC